MIETQQMLSVAEARTRILERFQPLPAEEVALEQAAGRVLAETVTAEADLPPFANSGMDGYAVRAGEVAGASGQGPVRLPVMGDIPAGAAPPGPLPPGAAVRIMTGAPLPPGADAVVPVEDTDDRRDRAAAPPPDEIAIFRPAAPGAHVRPVGQDVRAGQSVLSPGRVLRPADIGVLAALGRSRVQVHRRPRVAILSTGDELVPLGEPLGPGQIRDTNSHSLSAAVEACGGQALRLGIARDQAAAVRDRLETALHAGADVILSSAGVSVGAYDVVKDVVQAEGALDFWRVRMRPGKPVAFGHLRGVPFVGLPGNPVSALVSFEVFVRPVVLKLGGHRQWEKPQVRARLLQAVRSDGRESYLRVVLERDGTGYTARVTGDQGSAILTSLVKANGLLVVPEGMLEAPAGAELPVWLLEGGESVGPRR